MFRVSEGKVRKVLLLFVAAVAVALAVTFPKLRELWASHQVRKDIELLLAVTRDLHPHGSYGSLGASGYPGARLLVEADNRLGSPDSDGILHGHFGGAIVVRSAGMSLGTSNGFEIVYPNVPGGVCARIVEMMHREFWRIELASPESEGATLLIMEPGMDPPDEFPRGFADSQTYDLRLLAY